MIDHPAFPADPWLIQETTVSPDVLEQTETLLSLANGYLGLRGNLDEVDPFEEAGTYVNGFYETRPIQYGERAYGYAENDQTMLNVTDGKVISLAVDGEPLDVRTGRLESHGRELDMREAVLRRQLRWRSPGGHTVEVRSRRLVSFTRRHLAAVEYEVTAVDGPVTLTLTSEMVPNQSSQTNTADPRASAALYGQVLLPAFAHGEGERIVLGHVTRSSRMKLVTGMDHVVHTDADYEVDQTFNDDRGTVTYTVHAEAGTTFRLVKHLSYHTSGTDSSDVLHGLARDLLDEVHDVAFADLVAEQKSYVQAFWDDADVVIEGDEPVQQAVRFALFQILQASARAEVAGIAAKGLTGQGYEGHYFWDMETFVLGVLTYVRPEVARSTLLFRHMTLDAARRRAEVMHREGALFPWRTISGEEASAYFPAGTAQYHIDADIAYAVQRYVDATGDTDFMEDYGAEILVETARMWASLGSFQARRGGAFCIDEVTGPDEYSALVDNNTYTNLMAAANLRAAAAVASHLRDTDERLYRRLAQKTGLVPEEIDLWQRAADTIYVPFDDELGIHAQDDEFLNLDPWDWEGTSPDQYPLLLHFHPLNIYRYQVIKQADLILAMFLQGDRFTRDEKRAAFDYYDPITTGDSSLSACIQAVVAAEVGYLEKAYDYARTTALMDLANVNHNVRDGIHIAAMAGTWIALVHGFGGLRQPDGRLRFEPQLPPEWDRLAFPIHHRGHVLDVSITSAETTYSLRSGDPVALRHWGDEVTVAAGKPVTLPNATPATAPG